MTFTVLNNETGKAPCSQNTPVFPGSNVSCQEEQLRLLQEKDQGHVKIAKTSLCPTRNSTAAD